MTHPTPTQLFFAGTDTEVGKTYVASLVARLLRQPGHRVGVYKPVASGCEATDGNLVAADAVELWQAAGRPRTLAEVCPQRFIAPLAPPESAACEGKEVDSELLFSGADCWREWCDVLIIEGAGGLFSPLADGFLNIDVARRLDAQVIIVAANRLGVIHQTLACCGAAAHCGVQPCGIILSDPTGEPETSAASNARQIARYIDVPILASVSHGGNEQQVAEVQKLIH